MTPDGAAPIDVPVAVPAGHRENKVAHDIQSSLSAALDRKSYEVRMDGREDIVVKRMGGPTFNLKLIDSNVKNVKVEIDKRQALNSPALQVNGRVADLLRRSATDRVPGRGSSPNRVIIPPHGSHIPKPEG